MTSRNRKILDEFGQFAIREIYDKAFHGVQRIMNGEIRGDQAETMFAGYLALDAEKKNLVHAFAADGISMAFSLFLHSFDASSTPLLFRSSSGEVVDVAKISDGIAAEPYNEDGWIARFSKYRNGFQEAPELGGGESP